MDYFSPAQCAGYVALVLGVGAFLTRDDRRMKLLLSAESVVYGAHFLMLGNLPAAGSAGISAGRTYLSLRSRSLWLAAAAIALNIWVGLRVAHSGLGWLPIVGSCVATVGFFTLDGMRLRLVLLTSTLMWLANGYISRSIGGTVLESLIATANITTLVRMGLEKARLRAAV
ncbi:YgjV family protein [Paludibaculum fermentans]|uniref:YgjV family protein n=1 Tax=Paludibaculum fermentans TaxID=1473598 RepID=A0A7S7SJE1_PALFE|nr:YgjV family protein [Paludibaculum fermentans]QOY86588.1 YgjV family protein [Paludibaculum fermentans]